MPSGVAHGAWCARTSRKKEGIRRRRKVVNNTRVVGKAEQGGKGTRCVVVRAKQTPPYIAMGD